MLETLEKKKEAITAKFDQLIESLNERKIKVEELQKEMTDIVDEQKRLQGEYRAVQELLDEMTVSKESKDGDIVID
jgi:regulator of replication initiation timing